MAASVSYNGTSCLFERRNAAGRLLASEVLFWLLFQKLRLQRLALPFKEIIGWLGSQSAARGHRQTCVR
jgi:hypothetical protein